MPDAQRSFSVRVLPVLFFAAVFLFPVEGRAEELQPYSPKLWTHLEILCSFGARNPGSPGHLETRQYIKQVGQKFADKVVEQEFFFGAANNKRLRLFNIEFRFEGKEGGRPILLGAHYDTRPFADEDPDPKLREKPIIGANDGGSGTAMLLALAEYLHENKPRKPVRLVFFDGEDYGRKQSGEYFLGSTFYAQQVKISDKNDWPLAVLVIDMVGDKNLEIYKEINSVKSAPDLVDLVFNAAKRQGARQFISKTKYSIRDDHIPFARLNIPSAVLIDFDYPHWHTHKDTLDKCSEESLFTVFSVVVAALNEI